MKANANTVLVGEKVVLVPYRRAHVPVYHGWMCNEELRRLTASEPLSLEEEYEMQQKWAEDDDKLTFIVLARTGPPHDLDCSPSSVDRFPMVGDVNLFLKGTPPTYGGPGSGDDANNDGGEAGDGPDPDLDEGDGDGFEAEVEVMIAEPAYRRRGLASEALRLMLAYATGAPFSSDASMNTPTHARNTPDPAPRPPPLGHIPATRLVSRIAADNAPSIRLFERLGFVVTRRVEVFGEVEMRWRGGLGGRGGGG